VVHIDDEETLAILEERINRTAERFDLDPAQFPRPVDLVLRPGKAPQIELLYAGGIRIYLGTTAREYPQHFEDVLLTACSPGLGSYLERLLNLRRSSPLAVDHRLLRIPYPRRSR
jgi:hypothetical protein